MVVGALTYLRRVGAWIGTSGWSYDHRQDVLYHGCSPADRLGRYIAEFDTVELNASSYRWPRDAAFTSCQRRAACRVPPVGQGSACAHPRPEAVSARVLGRSDCGHMGPAV
jgi:hypothetical protein